MRASSRFMHMALSAKNIICFKLQVALEFQSECRRAINHMRRVIQPNDANCAMKRNPGIIQPATFLVYGSYFPALIHTQTHLLLEAAAEMRLPPREK